MGRLWGSCITEVMYGLNNSQYRSEMYEWLACGGGGGGGGGRTRMAATI